MPGFTNDDGEPIMDGAAYRFEAYLDDDNYEYAMDTEYGIGYRDYEPEQIDPKVCEHRGDKSYHDGGGMTCDDCWERYEGPKMQRGEWPNEFSVFMSRDLNR